MERRHLLHITTAALASGIAGSSVSLAAADQARFRGKIKKSLKWGMVKLKDKQPLVETFRKLRECGFEGIEPSTKEIEADAVDEWIAASRDSGLVIDGTVGSNMEDLNSGIDLSQRLGADSMLVVARYDQSQSIQPQWDHAVELLKKAAPYAEKKNVKLLVENVWATYLISPFDMVRFIDEINHPFVQVHFDIGNMVRWGVPEHWAEILGERSKKLDIKEYDLKIAMSEGMSKGFRAPLGEGSIKWAKVMDELEKINYSGWAAAEVAGGDWEHLTELARRMDKVLEL